MNDTAAPFLANQDWVYPLFTVMWVAITGLLSYLGGWAILARKFKTSEEIEGDRYRFISGSMGKAFLPVNYGNCLFATVGKTGFHLSIFIPFRFRSPPLFIPWSQIEAVKSKRFLFLFPYITIIVKDCWPQISLRGRVCRAVVESFTRYSQEAKNQQKNWCNK